MKHLKTSDRVRPVEEIKHPAAQSISDTELVMRAFDLSPEQIAIKQVDLLRGFHANWTERFAQNVGYVDGVRYAKMGSMPALQFLFKVYPNDKELVVTVPLEQGDSLWKTLREKTKEGCEKYGVRPWADLEKGDKALELPE